MVIDLCSVCLTKGIRSLLFITVLTDTWDSLQASNIAGDFSVSSDVLQTVNVVNQIKSHLYRASSLKQSSKDFMKCGLLRSNKLKIRKGEKTKFKTLKQHLEKAWKLYQTKKWNKPLTVQITGRFPNLEKQIKWAIIMRQQGKYIKTKHSWPISRSDSWDQTF